MKLYEYPQEMDKLVRLATEDGDLSDELIGELKHLGSDFKDKVVNCVKVITEMESSIDSLSAEIDRLITKRRSFKAKVDWLKTYVHDSMVRMEMDVVKDDLFTVRVQESPGRVEIVDQSMIPPEYLKHGDVIVLKAAIRDDLKAGREVNGCQLVKSTSLRIR